MIPTLEDILSSFDPAHYENILNKEFLFENKALAVSELVGNGVDKIVFALSSKESGSVTHVLKIFRRVMSEERFDNWKAEEARIKSAILEFNKTIDHKIDEYKVEFSFPESFYLFVNGWGVEVQEYIGGAYWDEIINNAKRHDLIEAIKANDPNKIIAEANNLLEQQPLIPDILQIKGQSLISLNRIDEGLDCLEQALEVDPGLQYLYSMLASANLIKGNLSQAKLYARQALGSNPNDIDTYITLFNAEIKVGNIKNAARTFTFLKEIHFPKDLLSTMEQQIKMVIKERNEIAEKLQKAFSSDGSEDSMSVAEVLSNIREQFPKHVFPWFISGNIALASSDLENAKKYFMEAYRLDSFDPENIFHLGYVNFASFCLDEAEQYLREWIDQISSLFITIQEKIKGSQGNALSITLEEGAFLESIDAVKRDCKSLLAYYNGLDEKDRKIVASLEDVISEVTNFWGSIKDFDVAAS